MPNKATRRRKKRRVTGSRRQRITGDDERGGFGRFLATWWWAGAVLLLIAVGLSIALLGGCARRDQQEASTMPVNPSDRVDMYTEPPPMQIDTSKEYAATISTAKGDIVISLDAVAAPLTVNNFVFLAREGFYDGLTFHRVEPDFVVQGGDPAGTGSGGPGYKVDAEIGLPHIKGAVATARTADQVNPERKSSGSQFYITLEATPFLDGGYTVFGRVTEGMDVVESIAVGDVIESVAISEGP
jgi:cyclophilin family peptidyl-prolyl cis-trans isomerase